MRVAAFDSCNFNFDIQHRPGQNAQKRTRYLAYPQHSQTTFNIDNGVPTCEADAVHFINDYAGMDIAALTVQSLMTTQIEKYILCPL